MNIAIILKNLSIEDNSVDDLINKVNNTKIHDKEEAWNNLLKNYKKLINLDKKPLIEIHKILKTINNNNLYYVESFGKSLDKNDYHISQVEFIKNIKYNLNMSVNTNIWQERLIHTRIAYENIISFIYNYS